MVWTWREGTCRKATPLACFAPARHERPSKPAGAALCSPPARPVRSATSTLPPLHMRGDSYYTHKSTPYARVAFSHAKIRGIMPIRPPAPRCRATPAIMIMDSLLPFPFPGRRPAAPTPSRTGGRPGSRRGRLMSRIAYARSVH